MTIFKKLAAATALALCALAPTAALAENVLLLATRDAPFQDNIINAFTNAGANVQQGPSLTTEDISSINFSEYATVIIATDVRTNTSTSNEIRQDNFNILKTQIQEKNDTAFIIFSDGCNNCDDTFLEFAKALGFSATKGADTTTYDTTTGAELNAQSVYSSYFRNLSSIRANAYGRITNASEDNRLYGADSNALAVFVPQNQNPLSLTGNSACTFLAGDLNIFQNRNDFPDQHDTVAQTLLTNVQSGSRACNGIPPPKLLYLSTAEQYEGTNPCSSNGPASISGRNFIENAVKSLSPRTRFINRAGALSTDDQIEKAGSYFAETAKWKEADFEQLGDGDIVVVQTAYQMMDPEKAAIIAQQIKDRPNLTFILLLDTCEHCSYDSSTCSTAPGGSTANLNSILLPAIDEPNGWDLKFGHLGNSLQVTNIKDAYDVSAYAHAVPAVPPIGASTKQVLQGHTTGALLCTPKQNVIFPSAVPFAPTSYKGEFPQGSAEATGWYCNNSGDKDKPDCKPPVECPPDKPNCTDAEKIFPYGSTWPELNASSAYGVLIPFWQNNKGKGGSCIYLGLDNNILDDTRISQHGAVAAMFLSLPDGACAVPREEAGQKGVCPGLKASEECVLAPAPDGTPTEKQDVLVTRQVAGDGTIPDEKMCLGKVWKNECVDPSLAMCAAGVIEEENCCVCANISASTSEGKLCCDVNEKPVGDPGSQTCCLSDNIAHDRSVGNAEICCNGADQTVLRDPASGANVCCGVNDKLVEGACCPTDPSLRNTCSGDQTPDTACCKCPDPIPACEERQDITAGCGCTCESPMEPQDGKCVTPVCPGGRTPCADGQVVVGECGCKCNKPYNERPVCKEGELPAPYEKSGAKSGSKADAKDAVYACCRPAPAASAPVPTTGWPALLGLGALLPLLARRQRRQGKRRDDDAS